MKSDIMTPPRPKVDAAYREYVGLRLLRHTLAVNGRSDDTQVDEIEEKLIDLWEVLDAQQKLSVNGLGSDLNWLERGGKLPPKGLAREQVTATMREELESAIARDDTHAILHHMRLCAAALRPECLAHNRAICYEAIGLKDMAVTFWEYQAGTSAIPEYSTVALRRSMRFSAKFFVTIWWC